MNSTFYLISRKLKNSIIQTFKNPGRLVIALLVIGLGVFTVLLPNDPTYTMRDRSELHALVLLFYSYIFFMTARVGFTNGAAMFSMADVNLIFTSPKKEIRVLSYGLLSQISHALFMGLILFYQYAWLKQAYGITVPEMLLIAFGYAVTAYLSQLCAMLIYTLTSGSDKKCTAFKGVFYAVVLAFIAYVVIAAYFKDGGQNMLTNIVHYANSIPLAFFPVAGIASLFVNSVLLGKTVAAVVGAACCVLAAVLYYIFVSVYDTDFYEDVLKAAEVSFSAITERKEGKAAEIAPRNVKVGKTGFKAGEGASAIYQKHRIEKRRSKLVFIEADLLILAVITAVTTFFEDIVTTVIMTAFLLLFLGLNGRWAKELTLPYIYMIPEGAFKKLFYTIIERAKSLLIFGLLSFLPMFFAKEATLIESLLLALSMVGFGLLFISTNLIISRFSGASESKVLLMTAHYLLSAFAAAPGLAFFLMLSETVSMSIGLIAMSAVNFVITLVLMFLSRNILNCAELNNK